MAKRAIREPGHLSRAAYARHRGCDPKEVQRAIKSGLIRVEKDGGIDPVRADRDWAAGTNPASAKKPGMAAHETTMSGKPGMKPVSAAAVKAAADVLRAAGQKVADSGGGMTFVQARTANEIIKSQLGALRLRERQGELIDKEAAKRIGFAVMRRVRDQLEAWPARTSPVLAAQLGVSAHSLERTLVRAVRELLTEIAGSDPDELLAALDRIPRKPQA